MELGLIQEIEDPFDVGVVIVLSQPLRKLFSALYDRRHHSSDDLVD